MSFSFAGNRAVDPVRQIARTGIQGRGRVKQVFDYPQLAHVWAQQEQEHGRSPKGQMYFHGPVMFSYGGHYPIARFMSETTSDGRRVVLFNSEKSTQTTEKHKSATRDALSGLPVAVFDVPNVNFTRDADYHADNLQHLVDALDGTAKRFARAHVHIYWLDRDHSTYEDLSPDQIETARVAALQPYVDAARTYADTFALACPDLAIDDKVQAIRDGFERYYSPAKIAARNATAAKRVMRDAAIVAQAYAYVEGVLPRPVDLSFVRRETLSNKWKLESAQRERQRALYDFYNKRSDGVVTEAEWLQGKGPMWQHFSHTLVRRVGDTLQTSRGAECPFKHAVVAFLKAQECRTNGTTWHRNGQQIRVGHFNVDAIDAEGNMSAGCHTLLWQDMLRLAVAEVPSLVRATSPLPAVI